MKNRFNMTSKAGHYIETASREELTTLRKNDPRFKYAHIKKALQAWDDVVLLGVIYPANLNSDRWSFIQHNRGL